MVLLRGIISLWLVIYFVFQPVIALGAMPGKDLVSSRIIRKGSTSASYGAYGPSTRKTISTSTPINSPLLKNILNTFQPTQTGDQTIQMPFFGPKVFRYDNKDGQPSIFTEQITLPSWATSPFTIVAVTNASGVEEVGKGSIKINNTKIITNAELKKVGNITRSIVPNQQNTLKVKLDKGAVQISLVAGVAAPTINTVTPNSANQQTSLTVKLSGTNFLNKITSASFGIGVSVGTADAGEFGLIDVTGLTDATTNITVAEKAALGPRNILVANGRQFTSLQNQFNVTTQTPPGQANVLVSTLAGSGNAGIQDGEASQAQFNQPMAVATDNRGGIYVADTGNNAIRFIDPSGKVSLYAGGIQAGFADGFGPMAAFNHPMGLAVDNQNNIYVADSGNNAIRKIDPTGNVTTIAGGNKGFDDGVGRSATFNMPVGITVDGFGNVIVADAANNAIRSIDIVGMVTTIAGDGNAGFSDGIGRGAEFHSPTGVAVDSNRNIFVTDTGNQKVRQIDGKSQVTTIAGDGEFGFNDAVQTEARFADPMGITIDRRGRPIIVDNFNSLIRLIDGKQVKTLAGTGRRGKVDGTGDTVTFNQPMGTAIDQRGIIYIADSQNNVIRRLQRGITGPVINDFDPKSGAPGTEVTIVGRGFNETTEVRFNDRPASFQIFDDTKLVATCPDTTSGSITVITPAGTFTTKEIFNVDNRDFILRSNNTAQVITSGEGTAFLIQAVGINGLDGKVSLSIKNAPPALRTQFNPSEILIGSDSQLLVGNTSSLVAGDYRIDIAGKAIILGREVEHDLTLILSIQNVGGVNPDFDIKAVPFKPTILTGKSTSLTINTISLGNLSGDINLSVANLPSGIIAALGANKVSAGQSTQLLLNASNTINPGNYDITITGLFSDGSRQIQRTATVNITVNINGQPEQDFTLNVSPQVGLILPGGQTSFSVDFTLLGVFNDGLDLSVENLPSGISAIFDPVKITKSDKATLTLSADSSAVAGRYTIAVVAKTTVNGSELAHKMEVTLVVAGNDRTTTLFGRVMTAESDAKPLAKVTVSPVNNPAIQVITDNDGRFTLIGLPAVVHQIINVDGHTADTPTETYPVIPLGVDLIPNQANDVGYLIYLPKIDTANIVKIRQNADNDQVITTPRIPNLKVVIPAHTTIVNLDGSPVPQISITPLLGNRMPMPMPDGLDLSKVPQLYTIQPGGALASKPIQIFYPNLAGLKPGQSMVFYGEDHDLGTFRIFGSGKVSEDGLQIIPDPDPNFPGLLYGLSRFSWHFPSLMCPGQPPNSVRIIGFFVSNNNIVLNQGQSEQLRLLLQLSDGRFVDATDLSTFSSNNPSVASVTTSGLVIANNNIVSSDPCPNAVIKAVIQSAIPGVGCTVQNGTVSIPVQVNAEMMINLVTTDNSFLKFNGKEAIVFKSSPLVAELNLKAGSRAATILDNQGQVLFQGTVSTKVSRIPLKLNKAVNPLTIQVGCQTKNITVYLLPNATIDSDPKPTPLALDKDNITMGTTMADISVISAFDDKSTPPPISSIELQIRKVDPTQDISKESGQVETVIATGSAIDNLNGIWKVGQRIDLKQRYKAAVIYNINVGDFGPVVAAASPLGLGALIVDYKRPVKVIRDINGNGNSCQTGNKFFVNLAQQAQVEIKIKVLDKDIQLFKGILDKGPQFPIKPNMVPAKLPIGEYPFTITATTTDGANFQEMVKGTFIISQPTNIVYPISHPLLKGVDIADGHLTQSITDITLSGGVPSLSFTRVYSNAAIVENSPMGPGWTHNLFVRLIHNSDCQYYLLVGPDGQSQRFSENFKPQRGFNGELKRVEDEFIYRTKDGIEFHFDKPIEISQDPDGDIDSKEIAPANLKSINDPISSKIVLDYEGGLLTQVTDNQGRALKFTYKKAGKAFRVSQVLGPMGSQVQYIYDQVNGNLLKSIRRGKPDMPDSRNVSLDKDRVWSYTYNDSQDNDILTHRIKTITDPNNNTTSYDYYSGDDKFSGEEATPSNCDSLNCNFLIVPNKANHVKRIIEPSVLDQNIITNFVYNQFSSDLSHITEVTDPMNNITSYETNSDGSPTKITQPLGVITTMVWNPANIRKDSMTDANKRVTTYKYDSLGNLKEQNLFTNDPKFTQVVTEYEFEKNFSRMTRKVEPYVKGSPDEKLVTTFDINPQNGNLNLVTNPAGQKTTYAYDPSVGNLMSQSDGKHTITYGYLKQNQRFQRPTATRMKVDDKTIFVTSTNYDERGRLLSQTTSYGRTIYRYDEFDRMVEMSVFDGKSFDTQDAKPISSVKMTYYEDDSIKTISQLKDIDNQTFVTTNILIDALNRRMKMITSGGAQTAEVTFKYDANSNKTEVTDGRNVTQITEYDALNRPIVMRVKGLFGGPNKDDNIIAKTTYDPVGNKKTETDIHNNTVTFEYDGLYQVKKRILPLMNPKTGQPYFEEFERDVNGKIRSLTDTNGNKTTFEYNDKLLRMTKMTNPLKRVMTFEYDDKDSSSNPLLIHDLSSKLDLQMIYDGLDRMTSKTVFLPNVQNSQDGSQLKYSTKFSYDDDAHLLTITNPLGNDTVMGFDILGRMLRKTIKMDISGLSLPGITTSFKYDGIGNKIAISEPNTKDINDTTHTTNFEYDDFNHLIKINYPVGPSESFSFDVAGLMLSHTDRNGILTEFMYDNLGRPLTTILNQSISTNLEGQIDETRPQLNLVSIDYDDRANTKTITDANDRKTRMEFDALNRAVKMVDGVGLGPLERVKDFTYDAINNTSASDWHSPAEQGNITLFAYDNINRLINITKPNQSVIQTIFDDFKSGNGVNTITTIDELGIKKITETDALNRTVRTINEAKDGTRIISSQNQYDAISKLIQSTDAIGNITRFTYDDAERLIRMDRGLSKNGTALNTTKFFYDNNSNLLAVTTRKGTTSDSPSSEEPHLDIFNAYDLLNRKISVTPGKLENTDIAFVTPTTTGTNTTKFEYDGNGNLAKRTDPYGNIITYAYDELNALIQVNHDFVTGQGTENFITERYRYDKARNRRVDYRTDYTVLRNYDALGRLSSLEEKKNNNNSAFSTTTFKYDLNDNVIEQTNPNNQVTRFEYDNLQRLKTKSYPTPQEGEYGPVTQQYAYNYDDDDNLRFVDEARTKGSSLHYEVGYDKFGRIASETDAFGKTISIEYYDNGQRRTLTDPRKNTISYSYDSLNRLSKVDSIYGTAQYEYFSDGLLKSIIYPKAQSRSDYDYDGEGRVKSVINRSNQPISSFTLAYNDQDKKIQLTEERPANSSGGTSGNETEVSIFSFGVSNRLTKIERSTKTNAGTDQETIDYSYDKSGNRTNQKVTGTEKPATPATVYQYVYDDQDHLRKVVDVTNKKDIAFYEYNYKGQRVRQTAGNNDTYSTYDGEQLLAEWDKAMQPTANYLWGRNLAARSEGVSGQSSYYLFNHLGSVTDLVDGQGQSLVNYRYDAWGAIRNPNAFLAHGNRLTFTAQHYDDETGAYCFGQGTRYYGAEIGRFYEKDPLFGQITNPLTLNRYAYALNDPIRNVDPTGMAAVVLLDQAGLELLQRAKDGLIRKGDSIIALLTRVDSNGNPTGATQEIALTEVVNGKITLTSFGESLLAQKPGAIVLTEPGDTPDSILSTLEAAKVSIPDKALFATGLSALGILVGEMGKTSIQAGRVFRTQQALNAGAETQRNLLAIAIVGRALEGIQALGGLEAGALGGGAVAAIGGAVGLSALAVDGIAGGVGVIADSIIGKGKIPTLGEIATGVVLSAGIGSVLRDVANAASGSSTVKSVVDFIDRRLSIGGSSLPEGSLLGGDVVSDIGGGSGGNGAFGLDGIGPERQLPASEFGEEAMELRQSILENENATQELKERFTGVSPNGNIAFARGEITFVNRRGETITEAIDLRAFSGRGALEGFETKGNTIIEPSNVLLEGTGRVRTNKFDSEIKIVESLLRRFPTQAAREGVTGELLLFSELTPCTGCKPVLEEQFNQFFPNIKLKVVDGGEFPN